MSDNLAIGERPTKPQNKRYRSIQIRIGLTFGFMMLLTAFLFGSISFIYAYTVEDEMFYRAIKDEIANIENLRERGQDISANRNGYMTLYSSVNDLPEALQQILAEEPNRNEFYEPSGRAYHWMTLTTGEYLVADVTDRLVVRNSKGNVGVFLLVMFGVVLVALISLIAFLMSKWMTKPLNRLVEDISGVPNVMPPAGFSGKYQQNEIGRLASVFDLSLQRINGFIKRERSFTRDVSHEVRTPTTVISGACELMKRTELSTEQSELLGRIELSHQQLTQTLEALLELAREKKQDTVESYAVIELVEDCIILHHQKIADKAIEIELEIPTDLHCQLPKGALKVLLSNLVSNAFNHTQSGIITFSTEQEGNELWLSVKDNGDGIDQDILDTVLEAGVKSSQSKGMGQGLSIVKRLCEHLETQYQLNSDSKGTEFKIQLR